MRYFDRTLKEKLYLILQAAWRSGVGKNAASLYLIQLTNYILPLILVPYLVRVLGPEHFGLVAFGQGLIAYFNIFVDYGFSLSATRRISVEREDPAAVSKTAFSVWAAKSLLCTATFVVLLGLISVVPKLKEANLLVLILYGVVVGNALFPVWLFQGMEKMFFIAAINLAMRILVVAGVFALVRRPAHYLLYAGLTSMGSLGAGIVGVIVALYKFQLRPLLPSWGDIQQALREGWLLFLSTASVSLYTAGNTFILGLLTNPTAVGYYSAAEKIAKAVLNLLGPIRQAVYPRFSKLAVESQTRTLRWGRNMFFLMGALTGGLSLILLLGAPLIVHVILGPEYEPSVTVLRILSVLVFAVGLNNVLGIQLILTLGHDKAFTLTVFSAGLLNVALAVAIAPIWQAKGMAVAVVTSEVFIVVVEFLYLQLKYSLFTLRRHKGGGI